MAETVYLSVIIPAFNAAEILRKNLPVLISYLKKQPYDYEIIVVDDGSDDKGSTDRVCREFKCICIHNPENMGKGASVRNGMKLAKGVFRIFTDADIPYEPDIIEEMLKHLSSDNIHITIGDRHLKDSRSSGYFSLWRRITSFLFTAFVGTIVTTSYFDTQCGIKGFRAEVSEFLFHRSRINGFTFDVEIIYISLKNHYIIKRIPVRLRTNEKSTVRVLRHGTIMFMDLFRIKYNQMKGYYR
jgi:dolichyl-phosphate beta-glucosyltransferase